MLVRFGFFLGLVIGVLVSGCYYMFPVETYIQLVEGDASGIYLPFEAP